MIYLANYDSPVGPLTIGSDGRYLIGVWFEGQKYDRDVISGEETEFRNDSVINKTIKWLDTYFEGKDPGDVPPVRIIGTEFKRMVCDIMLRIPFGKTMTYGEIAGIIAGKKGIKKMSAQAVGGAVGHNPVSIIVPCHRVVGTGGNLTGYGGGIDKKVWLLENEGIDLKKEGFFVPTKGTAL